MHKEKGTTMKQHERKERVNITTLHGNRKKKKNRVENSDRKKKEK